MDLRQRLETLLAKQSFLLYGLTSVTKANTHHNYQEWLDKSYHGSMTYLQTQATAKKNVSSLLPEAKSVIVLAQEYFPHPRKKTPFPALKTALYSQGEDYHFWLKQKLQNLIADLKAEFPDEKFFPATDSSAILERDFAHQAGLGWIGKNTCLIHPKKGSLFFLAEVITSLALPGKIDPLPDFCGTCTRCLDACPTQAFVAPRILDAKKCISYLTIESRQVPELELRPLMQDWFFGCDICQTVCPWNQKILKNSPAENIISSELEENLSFILTASGKLIEKKIKHTALTRAGSFGLKRNALVVIGNLKIKSLQSAVEKYLSHAKLGELASWTLMQLKS